MARATGYRAAALAVLLALLAGCAEASSLRVARSTPSAHASTPVSTSSPATGPKPAAAAAPQVAAAQPPKRAWLRIPAIGVDRLRVVSYRGTADDRPGTVIQDRGVLATPRGRRGGVGPGEVGNMVVTGHRTTHGRPFGQLPSVRAGDHVLVRSGGMVYDYRIIRTMRISFRSERDIARQSAPVPGRLGVAATRPMITLSTCATPEDHAAGNYWSDALGNPEHRIDKVGVLVDVRPV